jgi:DNA-binding transcriptional LysR family regulator
MKTLVIQSDFLTFLPRDLIYWEERSGQLRALDILAPSWRRLVGVTLRARGSITPAAEAAIAVLRKVAEEFL